RGEVEEAGDGAGERRAGRRAGGSADDDHEVRRRRHLEGVRRAGHGGGEAADAAVAEEAEAEVSGRVALRGRRRVAVEVCGALDVGAAAGRVELHRDAGRCAAGVGEVERLVVARAGGVDGAGAGLAAAGARRAVAAEAGGLARGRKGGGGLRGSTIWA